MQLEDIDFSVLTPKYASDRWGAGSARDRKIYSDDHLFYKVWSDTYVANTPAAIGNKFKRIEGLSELHGFAVGLFNSDIASAFVEYIRDSKEIIRGYVSHAGVHPDYVPDAFADLLFEACKKSGWVFSDLKPQNVIEFNSKLSLIDFDSHLCRLEAIDVDFEVRSGCLRPHVCDRFQAHIRATLSSNQPG